MLYLLLSFTILSDTLNNVDIRCIQDKRVDIVNFTLNFDAGVKNIEDIGYLELLKIILMEKFPEFQIMNYGNHFVVSFTLPVEDIKNSSRLIQRLFSEKITDKEWKSGLRDFEKEQAYHYYSPKDILIQTAFSKSLYGFSPYDFNVENFDKDTFLRMFNNIKHSYLSIIISGGINPCDVVNEIKDIFKKRKVIPKIKYPEYIQKGERIVILNKKEQNTLYLGVHLPPPNSIDFYSLYIFSRLIPEASFILRPPFLMFKYPILDTSNWENTLKTTIMRLTHYPIENINLSTLKDKIISDFYLKNAPFPGFTKFFLYYNINPGDWGHNIKLIEPDNIRDAVQKYLTNDNLTIVVGEER